MDPIDPTAPPTDPPTDQPGDEDVDESPPRTEQCLEEKHECEASNPDPYNQDCFCVADANGECQCDYEIVVVGHRDPPPERADPILPPDFADEFPVPEPPVIEIIDLPPDLGDPNDDGKLDDSVNLGMWPGGPGGDCFRPRCLGSDTIACKKICGRKPVVQCYKKYDYVAQKCVPAALCGHRAAG